jgi:hypothetical protein
MKLMARTRAYTEDRWRTESLPGPMLEFLRARRGLNRLKGGKRRLRLLGCAAARLVWDLFPEDRYRQAIDAAEKMAELEVRQTDMRAARDNAHGRRPETIREFFSFTFQSFASQFGWTFREHALHESSARLAQAVTAPGGGLAHALAALAAAASLHGQWAEGDADHARLVRCVFGNPFRAVPFDDIWRTPDAVALARSAWGEGGAAALPILADALEDAGCSDPEALAHLRTGERHARGCWAVDAVLGHVIEWPFK